MANKHAPIRYYRNALLWAFFILVVCLIPMHGTGGITFFGFIESDKVVHFGIFGLLYMFFAWGVRKHLGRNPLIISILGFIACTAFGALIEYLQSLPLFSRSFDIHDIIADAIGVLCAAMLIFYQNRQRENSL